MCSWPPITYPTTLSSCVLHLPEPHQISCDSLRRPNMPQQQGLSFLCLELSSPTKAWLTFSFTSDLCSNMLLSESSSCQLSIKSGPFYFPNFIFLQSTFPHLHILFFFIISPPHQFLRARTLAVLFVAVSWVL